MCVCVTAFWLCKLHHLTLHVCGWGGTQEQAELSLWWLGRGSSCAQPLLRAALTPHAHPHTHTQLPKYYYWELVIQFRKILFVGVAVLFEPLGALPQGDAVTHAVFVWVCVVSPHHNITTQRRNRSGGSLGSVYRRPHPSNGSPFQERRPRQVGTNVVGATVVLCNDVGRGLSPLHCYSRFSYARSYCCTAVCSSLPRSTR